MQIRTAIPEDAEQVSHVHQAVWQTTYGHLVPQDSIAEMTQPERIERRRKWIEGESEHFLVAELNGEVIGFVSGGRERNQDPTFQSECMALYLLKEHQGKGYGRDLFLEVCRRLKADGHQTMIVWVLAENPTNGFYQKMGGRRVHDSAMPIGGVWFPTFSYGWFSLPTS